MNTPKEFADHFAEKFLALNGDRVEEEKLAEAMAQAFEVFLAGMHAEYARRLTITVEALHHQARLIDQLVEAGTADEAVLIQARVHAMEAIGKVTPHEAVPPGARLQ